MSPYPCLYTFPFIINQRGCNIFFKTPEEAIEAGSYLQTGWCKTNDAFKNYNSASSGTGIGPVVEAP